MFSLTPILIALAAALILTPLVRAAARRYGAVARPKEDRWHKSPTAMLGGVAIFLSTVIACAGFVPLTRQLQVVLLASALLFVVGLVDDFLHIKPYQKLIGQIMGAAIVIYFGIVLPWTAFAPLNMMLTILWLVGITNAVNLLDNMDGLAAGIAAIAASFLGAYFLTSGQPTEALVLTTFAAALIGFLIYNSNPASIFMGDCGSMFIGFFLAAAALLSATGGRSRTFLPVLAVPVLVLFVPIFDTTFVTLMRKLSGRAASQGGRDHTSHRLVALGMSERRAVWMLYGFAAAAGVLAMLVRDAPLDRSLASVLGFTVLLVFVGVYLAGVKVYSEEEVAAARERPFVSFLVDLSYKRRVFEVLLDVALIVLAYYAAYAFVFGSLRDTFDWRMFVQTVPVLVFVKLAANLVTGVYRGLWRYTGASDLVTFAKASVLGSVASILLILFAFRFQGFSRTVFFFDCLLLFAGLTGSRIGFKLFRGALPTHRSREGRRVLIYGAGDAGELLLREILNNPDLQLAPVGFIDDDPRKRGKVIHGLRVHGGNGSLRRICTEQRAEEVVISSTRFPMNRVIEIQRDCERERVRLRRMRIELELLSDN